MKRVRRQKNKSARIKFKQKRNVIIIVIIALCLFAIYGFNLWTRSEVLKTTAVKFVEYETGRELVQEIEVHKEDVDEDVKYYIYLPEDVNGYNVVKFIDSNFENNEDNIKPIDEEIDTSNVSDSLFDSVLNTVALENINTIDDNEVNETTNTTVDNTVNENTNTTVDNIVNENTNTIVDNTVNENTNTIVDNTVSKNTNTAVENTVSENINTAVDNTVNENTIEENNDDNNVIFENEISNENKTNPGAKIYLSEQDVIDDTIVVNVEFDTKLFDNTRLYNRNLKYEDEEAEVIVSGYIPYEYYLSVKSENIEEMEKLKSDVDELKKSIVLAAYDIKILNGENSEYQPIEYNQVLNVSVESKERFDGRLIGREVDVVHVDETEEEIVFEKVEITDKTVDTISCNAVKFSKYLVLVAPSVTSSDITINDYESDYNYYMGKNFTDDFDADNENIYSDSNLARVTINYYSAAPADRGTENEAHIGLQDNPATAVNEAERQTLIIYNKAVPIVDQKVSVELIDNPYNDRPVGKGFDGWTFSTTENAASSNITISTHQQTYVQTLTATIGNAKNIVINLYPNWVDASVVFFNPDANNNGNGLSASSPVNSWTNVRNWFNSNSRIKNINNASDREVNIVVLCGGESHSFGANILTHAFTLTGFYNGTDYRSDDCGIRLSSGNNNNISNGTSTPTDTILNNDYQISYINILNSNDYTRSTEATDNIGSFYMTANSYNLRIGRGMTPLRTGNNVSTLGQIRGATPGDATRSYRIVIETGKYCNIQAGHPSPNTTGSGWNSRVDSTINGTPTLILGSDIDRAKTDNENLKIYARVASRSGNADMYPASDMNGLLYDIRIKSGSIGTDYFENQLNNIVNGADSNAIYAGIYVGGHGTSGDTDFGTRQLIVEGGKIANIIGGLKSTTAYMTKIYIKGGYTYNIVAGAGRTETRGDRLIQITDGKIYYSVSGGSNGFKSDSDDNGILNGKNLIYVGGNAVIGAVTDIEGNNNPLTSYTLYGVEAGCVLGAGNGNADTDTSGQVTKTTIIVDGNANIRNSVYGGGNHGYVKYDQSAAEQTTDPIESFVNKSSDFVTNEPYMITSANGNGYRLNVNTDNNTINRVAYNRTQIPPKDWVFEPSATIGEYYIKNLSTNMYLGITYNYSTADGYLEDYNGTYVNDYVTGISGVRTTLSTTPTSFKVTKTGNNRVQISNSISYTYYTSRRERPNWQSPYRNVLRLAGTNNATYYLNLSNNTTFVTNQTNVYILDYILTPPPPPPPPPEFEEGLDAAVTIDIYDGNIGYNIYGGSNQNNIYGSSSIDVMGGTINGKIYGGSNVKGSITGRTQIHVSGGTVGNDNDNDVIFGGGLGTETKVLEDTLIFIDDSDDNVDIKGIIYGGSEQGTIEGNSLINIKDVYDPQKIVKVSGTVFGGGKGITGDPADTNGFAKIVVDGGNYDGLTLFGGCNYNGTINGSINVDVGETLDTTVQYVYGAGNESIVSTDTDEVFVRLYKYATVEENVFNGGNSAGIDGANTTVPRAIYLKGATVNGSVYGGCDASGTMEETFVYCMEGSKVLENVYGSGLGSNTSITGNTNVFITSEFEDGSLANPKTTINGSVFGGGEAAPVEQNTNILIEDAIVKQSVYGGGDQAVVDGKTIVNIKRSQINANVFGGGNNAVVDGTTTIGITGASTITNVYGGGNNGAVNGNADIRISERSTAQNVFGGGAKANLNSFSNTTIDNAVIGNVYGGGEEANVTGATTVDIVNSSTVDNVFGGGKGTTATLGGLITVEITNSVINENVYGGGDAGPSNNNINLTINNSNVKKDVFGAGKGATSTVTGSASVTIGSNTVIGNNVYGGGDNGPVRTNTNIKINGGSTITNDIFGGGNAALVNNRSSVNISGASKANNVYGGGNQGNVTGSSTTVIIEKSIIGLSDLNNNGNVYGGGNQGSVGQAIIVTIDDSTVQNSVFGAGKGASSNAYSTMINFQNGSTAKYVYGGGDQGIVDGNGTNTTINNSLVKISAYGGGNGDSDASNKGKVTGNIYINVKGTTIIGEGNVLDEYGHPVLDVYGEEVFNGSVFGGGRGKTALVVGDINVNVNGSTVRYNVYGGGDNGDVSGSTAVKVTNATVLGSAFGAGNGIPDKDHTKHIARVSGDSSIIIEGSTQVVKHVFAGGNAAKTGAEYTFSTFNPVPGGTALSMVEISGGNIGRNVYGGANASIVMGNSVVNIGKNAIDEYHGSPQDHLKGNIKIGGEIFGAGEAINIGQEGYENSEFSVTQTTDINIDGEGYNQENGYVLEFSKSIFGSGNASRPIIPGSVTIKNLGTKVDPYRLVSIQRSGEVKLDGCSMQFSGTVDTTATYPNVTYSLNMIEKLVIKNNTTIYMRNGANQVKEFWSMHDDENGDEVKASVEIPVTITGVDKKVYNATGTEATDETGKEYLFVDGVIYQKDGNVPGEVVTEADLIRTGNPVLNSDNRLYVFSGVNVDIAKNQSPTDNDYGEVYGMTFFGIYKEYEGDDLYEGMYAEDYALNDYINWEDRDYNRSYVQGMHKANHDITEDGFYTVFEQLQVELEPDQELTEEIYGTENSRSISYMNYIDPTPDDAAYYMWYAGPDSEVFYYTFNMIASKFSTLGTKLLTLDGISYPNATIKITEQMATLANGVSLVDKSLIPNVNPNQDEANKKLGLGMKTSNTGWAMNGNTDFYSVNNSSSRSGDDVYIIENSGSSPALQFFLYHSNNITEDNDLGMYRIEMSLAWKKNLTRGGARIIIDIQLSTAKYEGNYYNAALAPGRQHELFASTTTNITTESSFSAFFEMSEMDFMNNELVSAAQYPSNAKREIFTSYRFPVGTTITMLDISKKENPEYYYYIVTQGDYDANKTNFALTDFKAMGSTDKTYDEITKMDEYLDDTGYQYESFIFTVDFENADFGELNDFVVTEDQDFTLVLYGNKVDEQGNIVPGEQEALYSVMEDQQLNMKFGIYNTESVIDITKAELTKDTIYPGSNTVLNLEISYNNAGMEEDDTNRVFVNDTRYYDKKMGAKITMYEVDNGVIKTVPGSSLLGTYFKITQKNTAGDDVDYFYYPRADGTTRIKLAEKVSNLASSITIDTQDSTLNGQYIIKIETFGSADGIYYGLEVSDSEEVTLTVIDNIYGLNSTIPENETIVDMATGHVLEPDTGYISETDNKVTVNLEYKSGLENPYITVKMLRRLYNSATSLEYEVVDMKDYIDTELINVNPDDLTLLPNEYVALTTGQIESVTNSEQTNSVFFDFMYEMGEDLVSGTYKVQYTLYDVKEMTFEEYDDLGNFISSRQEITYQYVGDTFSYIIIK